MKYSGGLSFPFCVLMMNFKVKVKSLFLEALIAKAAVNSVEVNASASLRFIAKAAVNSVEVNSSASLRFSKFKF